MRTFYLCLLIAALGLSGACAGRSRVPATPGVRHPVASPPASAETSHPSSDQGISDPGSTTEPAAQQRQPADPRGFSEATASDAPLAESYDEAMSAQGQKPAPSSAASRPPKDKELAYVKRARMAQLDEPQEKPGTPSTAVAPRSNKNKKTVRAAEVRSPAPASPHAAPRREASEDKSPASNAAFTAAAKQPPKDPVNANVVPAAKDVPTPPASPAKVENGSAASAAQNAAVQPRTPESQGSASAPGGTVGSNAAAPAAMQKHGDNLWVIFLVLGFIAVIALSAKVFLRWQRNSRFTSRIETVSDPAVAKTDRKDDGSDGSNEPSGSAPPSPADDGAPPPNSAPGGLAASAGGQGSAPPAQVQDATTSGDIEIEIEYHHTSAPSAPVAVVSVDERFVDKASLEGDRLVRPFRVSHMTDTSGLCRTSRSSRPGRPKSPSDLFVRLGYSPPPEESDPN